MNIITGYRGEPHITAQEDRDINLGIVGNSLTDVYVLNVGQQLEADIVSANEVRIRDGILIMQGCAASIDYGAYDSLTISNGTQGMLRTDIIAAQYEKDADTNVESLTLVVIEGTPDASDPQAPSLQGGDIQGGDNLVQLPLYKVNIDGVAIDTVEAQFIAATSLSWCTLSSATIEKWNDIAGGASTDVIMDCLADNFTKKITTENKSVTTGTSQVSGYYYGNIDTPTTDILSAIPYDITSNRLAVVNIIDTHTLRVWALGSGTTVKVRITRIAQ